MEVGLMFAAVLGIIPGMIAQSKGRSFWLWWLYGAAIFIIALPHALLLKADVATQDAKALERGEMKKCLECAELVRADAKVCRFCQFRFGDSTIPAADMT